MGSIRDILNWFSGGSNQYMPLVDCMSHDYFWIAFTLGLDGAIALGYCLIALHWWKNARTLPDSPAKRALSDMRNIFLFCGICGYLFIPIKMWWPAWRLYDFFMIVLVYSTWKYAWNARGLRVLYGELGRSSKLAADLASLRKESRQKSVFLNSLSHDLRTPLNGLVLQTNLIRMGVDHGNKELVDNALLQIENSAKATAEMLDRLLEYARLNGSEEQNALQKVNIGNMIARVCGPQQAIAQRKGVLLKTKVAPDIVVETDPVKLERILTNLVTNAMKFTTQGEVTVQVEEHDASIEIHVMDTGIGIAPEHQDRLFQEFFQVSNTERNPEKGFGLGLATARRLALQLGGDITVQSAVGRGSRFSVLLPECVVGDEHADQRVATERTAPAGN